MKPARAGSVVKSRASAGRFPAADAGRCDLGGQRVPRLEPMDRLRDEGAAAGDDGARWAVRGSALEFTLSACRAHRIPGSASELGSRAAR